MKVKYTICFVLAMALAGAALAEYDDYTKLDSPYGENFGDSPLNYQEAQPTLYNKDKTANCYYWSDHSIPAEHPDAKYYITDDTQIRGALASNGNTLYKSGVRHAVWPTAEFRLGRRSRILWKWIGDGCSYEFPNLVTMNGSVLNYNADPGIAEIRGKLTVNDTLIVGPASKNGENYVTGYRIKSQVIGDSNAKISIKVYESLSKSGIVELVGDNDAFVGTVSVDSNAVFFGSSGLKYGKVTATQSAYVGPRAANGVRVALSNLCMDATCSLYLNPTNTLVLTNAFTYSGKPKVTVGLSDLAVLGDLSSATKTFTLLELPKASWEVSSFEIESRFDSSNIPGAHYDVVTSDDGNVQRLVLVVPQQVTLLRGGIANAGWGTKDRDSPFYGLAKFGDDYYWSDHDVPQSGKVYVINGGTGNSGFYAYLPELDNNDYWTFNGDILQIKGKVVIFGYNNTKTALRVNDLRLATTSYTAIDSWRYQTENKLIGGTISIDTPQFRLQIRNQVTFVLDSALCGAGMLNYVCTYAETNASQSVEQSKQYSRSTLVIPRDNSSFVGDFKACAHTTVSGKYGYAFPSEETCGKVLIPYGSSLGGAIDSFRYNSIRFCDYSTLIVTNSVTIGSANRGLYIGGSEQTPITDIARFNVTNAEDILSVNVPITYDGELRKEGCGILALGAKTRFGKNNTLDDETTPTAGKNLLTVTNGFIMARHVDGVKDLALAFAADTGIAVDAEATGELKTYGFKTAPQSLIAVGKIHVKPANATSDVPFTVAICTLPNTTAMTVASFSPVKVDKMCGHIESRNNGDGTITFTARYERLGTVLLFR